MGIVLCFLHIRRSNEVSIQVTINNTTRAICNTYHPSLEETALVVGLSVGRYSVKWGDKWDLL